MQRLIIGFHRIATMEKSLDMRNLFETARDQAQAVLCEIRSIMNKVNIQYVLQTSAQLTDTDANDSWFNWVMLREYFNQLEYIAEVSHLIVKSEPAWDWLSVGRPKHGNRKSTYKMKATIRLPLRSHTKKDPVLCIFKWIFTHRYCFYF